MDKNEKFPCNIAKRDESRTLFSHELTESHGTFPIMDKNGKFPCNTAEQDISRTFFPVKWGNNFPL